ncbi:MAG TPA: adenylate/guanylate cyclase domain-containing protein [Thermodesulfovibrionales bacterium]|nr:adenylate/guanylate cyclase domain-containing protein [Thermodesulfovibrionales bacterium]
MVERAEEGKAEKEPSLWERLSFFHFPIRVKLSIAITFIIWLTILILSFVILARQKEQLYLQTVKTGNVSLNYFASNANIPLLNDDLLRLNQLIKEATSVEGLLYAIIVDRQGVIQADTDQSRLGSTYQKMENAKELKKEKDVTYFNYLLPSGTHILDLSKPVMFKNKALGEVHVGVSLDFINDLIRRERVFILVLSLFIVLLGISIAVLLGFSFSRPILKLVLATKEIGKGNYQYRIDMARKDEFGDLATAFNYMAQELLTKLLIKQSFGRYVSPEVLDMILSHPEEAWLKGKRNEATILFTDVRDFTAFSETRNPEEIVDNLNEYFEIATQVILEHGGYVDKFIGDAVLGVFGVPISHEDHVFRAVDAAVAMQKRFHEKADGDKNPLLTRIGIGINTGIVVSGSLGSQVKMEYTVIGDSVNVASRINHIAGAGEIIVSKGIYDVMKDRVTANALPPQRIKGKTEAIEVYQIVDVKTSKDDQGGGNNGA